MMKWLKDTISKLPKSDANILVYCTVTGLRHAAIGLGRKTTIGLLYCYGIKALPEAVKVLNYSH